MSIVAIMLGLEEFTKPKPISKFKHLTISQDSMPRPGGSAVTKAEKIEAIYESICNGVSTISDLSIDIGCSHSTVKNAIAFLEGRGRVICENINRTNHYSANKQS